MNERIRQLALQAKIGTADFDAGSYYVATPDRMEKFAELIIAECTGICEDIGTEGDGQNCVDAINDHFDNKING
jgi:hypothetical protein